MPKLPTIKLKKKRKSRQRNILLGRLPKMPVKRMEFEIKDKTGKKIAWLEVHPHCLYWVPTGKQSGTDIYWKQFGEWVKSLA